MENNCMLGEFIARRRKELGMTQKDLASQVGVSDKAVSKWETLDANPDISLLLPLSKILQTTVEELLGGEKNATEAPVADEAVPIDKKRRKGDKIRYFGYVNLSAIMAVIAVCWLVCLALAFGEQGEKRSALTLTFAILAVIATLLCIVFARKAVKYSVIINSLPTDAREVDGYLIYRNLDRVGKKEIRKRLWHDLRYAMIAEYCLYTVLIVFFVLNVVYEQIWIRICWIVFYVLTVATTIIMIAQKEKWMRRNKIITSSNQYNRLVQKK